MPVKFPIKPVYGSPDQQQGGPGDDIFFVDHAGDLVIEAPNQGRDVVYATVNYALQAGTHVEVLSAANLGGTDPLQLSGNELNNEIYGNAGANVLRGGGGSDLLLGGFGDDTYYITSGGETIFEYANEGRDVIYTGLSHGLAAGSHVEVLSAISLSSTDPLQLSGNELNQEIYGNAGANVLRGGGGSDLLLGGFGDDQYYITSGGETIFEYGNEGRDIIYTGLSHALATGSHVEVLSAISLGATDPLQLSGNELNNEIYGNAGANILGGGGGTDLLLGGHGDDTYYVTSGAEIIFDYAGEGRDIIYASVSHTLAAGSHVEILSAISLSSIDALNFGGNALDNYIFGNAGSNILHGGGGLDNLIGGLGDDTYYLVGGNETLYESAGGGRDIAYAHASYILTAGAEIEILSAASIGGTIAINLTGNASAQEIDGNDGANILDGGGGNDLLIGFRGDDIYFVDAGDSVVEGVNAGRDIVYATSDYTLSAGQHVEVLSAIDIAGQGNFNLTGNEQSNEIYGNAGANVLSGGGGSDWISGGRGADTLVGEGGGDWFVFDSALGNGNIDAIADYQGGGLDHIVLYGGAGGPFAALAVGQLGGHVVVVGSAALDENDYIIYNSATGALLYDADGNGAAAAVHFATIQAGITGFNGGAFQVRGDSPFNNAPTVTSGGVASVAENSAASTIVYQATANDADGDRVTYSLAGADRNLFTVDANGAVRLITPADFEAKASYSFRVFATDSNTSGPIQDVTLTILNVLDATPTPGLDETASANDGVPTAQVIDRNALAVGDSTNLHDPSLRSIIIQGAISGSDDRDFFRITLAAGELLILDVDNSGGNLDTYLRLWSPTGNTEIAANDDLATLDPGSAAHPVYGHNTDSFLRFRAPTDGTYYFSIESFQDPAKPTSGSYELNVSVGPAATSAQIFEEDIQALISGSAWNRNDLTYGFPTAVGQYPAGIEETDEPGELAPFTTAQQAATAQLLQLISNVSTLTFEHNAASPGNADLRYAMSNHADVAFAYYPTNGGPSSLGGSAWFNQQDFTNPVKGNYAWLAILHETGHALGLKHGHETPAVNAVHDTLEYTVMTYRSHLFSPVTDEDAGYTNETWSYPQTLMMLDIAALQRIYGANFSHNAGDSVYTWSTQTAEMSINGVGQGAPGGGRIFMTLWDGGGIDTYDFSNAGNGVDVDLRPGEWTRISSGSLASLGNGSSARGNIANALLFQDDPRSLIENVVGSAGPDVIVANQAQNRLNGGGHTDRLEWHSVADCGLGSQADIVNWDGSDRLSLTVIDANATTPDNDTFTFIGTSAFHNVAGELRYQTEGNSIRLQGDVDGNGIADLEIVVDNTTIFSSFHLFL